MFIDTRKRGGNTLINDKAITAIIVLNDLKLAITLSDGSKHEVTFKEQACLEEFVNTIAPETW